uniref:non-specific serine/threonine protein kinase n=1 Tax=Oryza punctata TaxID=4537 RepID=A0A0E0JK98_ORYPU
MQPHILLLLAVLLLSSPTWTAAGGEDPAVAVASLEVNPLHYNCSLSGGKYDPNSTYEANLKALASLLLAEARATAFASDSFGVAPDAVYGIALCRGDYVGDACADGLRKAFRDAIEHGLFCANFRDVTVYYDEHMFRFSGEDFRASLTNAPAWVTWNMNSVAGAATFGDRVMELINKTAHFAAWNSSRRRYATGEAGFGELDVSATHLGLVEQQCRSSPDLVIFALVQCTPDLSPAGCLSCLAGIASQMPRWFAGAADYRLGGRILGVRCNLRYEVDRFFLESNETIKIHMPRQKGPLSAGKISGIVAGILAFFVIIFALILFGLLKVIQDSERQRKLDNLEAEILEEISRSNTKIIGAPVFSRYTLQKLREATGDFSKENEIGKGGFGHVYQGKLPCGLDIAVKRLSVSSSGQGSEQFMNEIKHMATLQHRNLVRLLGFCIQDEEHILVYEYMANRSLDDVFSDTERKDRLLNWSTRLHIIDSIAQGLLYLHNFARQNTCIVHRDIKASNILLDDKMNAKISDFGIAKIFCSNLMEPALTRGWGTFGYTAPEVFLNGTISNKCDVYSFGVLVLEIISGTKAWQLWNSRRCTDLLDRSLGSSEGENIARDEDVLVRYVQMALLCVQGNPDERPSIDKVVAILSNTEALDVPNELPAYYNIQVHNIGGRCNTTTANAITPYTVFYTTTS